MLSLKYQNIMESKKLGGEKPLNLIQYRVHRNKNIERNDALCARKAEEVGAA